METWGQVVDMPHIEEIELVVTLFMAAERSDEERLSQREIDRCLGLAPAALVRAD